MDKHTPGPWVVEASCIGSFSKRKQKPTVLMVVAENGGMPGLIVNQGPIEERDYANAHLVAAAPDLLEALRIVASPYYPSGMLAPGHRQIIEAAIAKARGETK